MKTKNLILAVITLVGMIATGCKKETGCMNINASNYSSTAEKDDGSCSFEGTLSFWYDGTTASFLQTNNVTALQYYVNGILIGSSASSVYFTSTPNCSQNGVVSVTKSLGSAQSKTFSYTINDQDGYKIWSGSATLDASQSCTQIKLTQ